mmetsp:Transcript_27087/g.37807  ORF Transcript_27087/g.37807 Transcript_27087/m.37807 type:complete len:226 (+) Transcript_27087:265-942(+)
MPFGACLITFSSMRSMYGWISARKYLPNSRMRPSRFFCIYCRMSLLSSSSLRRYSSEMRRYTRMKRSFSWRLARSCTPACCFPISSTPRFLLAAIRVRCTAPITVCLTISYLRNSCGTSTTGRAPPPPPPNAQSITWLGITTACWRNFWMAVIKRDSSSRWKSATSCNIPICLWCCSDLITPRINVRYFEKELTRWVMDFLLASSRHGTMNCSGFSLNSSKRFSS